jgi:soluble lytic murein transglycosylase-like protein
VASWGGAVAAPPTQMVTYWVKSGDTLSQLAKDTCDSIEQIMARNSSIKNPNVIFVNQPLLLQSGACLSPRKVASVTVSPGEFASHRRASREKQILIPPEKKPAPIFTPSPKGAQTTSLSEERHDDIYRVVELRKRQGAKTISRAERSELASLTSSLRQAVLAKYPLKNPDCLYERNVGKDRTEQTLSRVRCIRENYGAELASAARNNGLSESLLIAVIVIESGGQPDAISLAGCTGLKQFTLRSAKHFGLRDRFDPFESIHAGARHLADNLKYWGGNLDKAIAAYNIGPRVVRAPGFDASQFPYTRSVRAVERLVNSV